MNAYRFMWRWNTRVLRREWRQYFVIFSLVAAATAISAVGVVSAYNLTTPPENTYGRGEVIATVAGDTSDVEASLDDQRHPYGVIRSSKVPVEGSAQLLTIQVTDPQNPVVAPLVDITDGRWPTSEGELAVTDRAFTTEVQADTAIGDRVDVDGSSYEVVGIVENPVNLRQEFVAASTLDQFDLPPTKQTSQFMIDAAADQVTLPVGTAITLSSRSSLLDARTATALAVNVVSALTLLEVALLVGAGFAVIAQRRSRQYGLLGAAGATPRQIRATATVSGTVVGGVGAAVGTVVGLVAAGLVVPALETVVHHRISLALPWRLVLPNVVLAVFASSVATRWPARRLSKQSIVQLLGSLKPNPSPITRVSITGVVLTALGVGLLVLGFTTLQAWMAVTGILVAPVGILLLAPLLASTIGRSSSRLGVASRMGGRALARNNRRSAAVIAALAIALGIPVGLVVVTTSIDRYQETTPANLDETTALVWVPGAEQPIPHFPATRLDPTSQEADTQILDRLEAVTPDATVAPITVAFDDTVAPFQENFDRIGPQAAYVPLSSAESNPPATCLDCDAISYGELDDDGNEIEYRMAEAWVATPELLTAFDLTPLPDSATGIVRPGEFSVAGDAALHQPLTDGLVVDEDMPLLGSLPPILLAPDAVAEQSFDLVTIGWVITSTKPITADQQTAINNALGGNAITEFRAEPQPKSSLRALSMLIGLTIGLGIAVSAVQLFVAESAEDLRVLRSVGASPATARRLSASMAGILGGAGAVLAVGIGYLGLVPLLTFEDVEFPFVVPWLNLAGFLILFPASAAGIGWIMAGRSSVSVARPSS